MSFTKNIKKSWMTIYFKAKKFRLKNALKYKIQPTRKQSWMTITLYWLLNQKSDFVAFSLTINNITLILKLWQIIHTEQKNQHWLHLTMWKFFIINAQLEIVNQMISNRLKNLIVHCCQQWILRLME